MKRIYSINLFILILPIEIKCYISINFICHDIMNIFVEKNKSLSSNNNKETLLSDSSSDNEYWWTMFRSSEMIASQRNLLEKTVVKWICGIGIINVLCKSYTSMTDRWSLSHLCYLRWLKQIFVKLSFSTKKWKRFFDDTVLESNYQMMMLPLSYCVYYQICASLLIRTMLLLVIPIPFSVVRFLIVALVTPIPLTVVYKTLTNPSLGDMVLSPWLIMQLFNYL